MKKLLVLLALIATFVLAVSVSTAQAATVAKSAQAQSIAQTEIAPVAVIVQTTKGPMVVLRITHCGFHDTGWVCNYIDHPAPVPYGNGYLYCLSDYRWHWLVCN